jgi:hypothetical protein
MNGYWRLTIAHALVLSLLGATSAFAQAMINSAAAEKILNDKIASLQQRAVVEGVTATPLTTPVATQRFSAAPAPGDTGVDIVPGPSLTKLLSLATESNLVSFGKDKTTLSVNPFMLVSVANPSVLDRQSLYERYALLRRFAGTLTFGGTGEKLDRDGDGVAEPVATLENPFDIVTWEAQAQVYGTRDRRDPANFNKYFASAVAKTFSQLNVQFAAFLKRWSNELKQMAAPNGELLEGPFRDFLERDDVEAELLPIAALRAQLLREHQAVDKEVDRQMVWTLTAGATHQSDEFGPDKFRIATKGVWSFLTGPLTWDSTVNVGYTHAAAIGVLSDSSSLIFGWKLGTKLGKSLPLVSNGIDWSAGVAGEHYQDVPTALHDNIVKASTTLAFNFTKSVSVPLTVTYANHRDLLTKQNRVFGHIGLSYELPNAR